MNTVDTDNRPPVVRAARADDLDAIVDVEFEAFGDCYKSPLDTQTVADVRQKFADRLELLGQWALVLEAPAGSIVGMSLAYPAKTGISELIELSDQGYAMTETHIIRQLLDENGTTLCGLNLAVLKSAPMVNGTAFLSRGRRALSAAQGIQHSYFFSRLPGLARWAAAQLPGVNVADLPRERQDVLAVQYLQATVQRGGMSRMADQLLAMYVDSGAVPVKLTSHWGASRPVRGFIDMPSLGYQVLCERRFTRRTT